MAGAGLGGQGGRGWEAVDADCGFFRGRMSPYLGISGDIASRCQLLAVIQKTIFTGTAGPEGKSKDCFWHCCLGLGVTWAADCGDLIGERPKNAKPNPIRIPQTDLSEAKRLSAHSPELQGNAQ